MTAISKHLLLCFFVFVLFTGSCVAAERDSKADLITVSTRFVQMHSRTSHEAGDPDEQFIEDIITPSIRDVVENGGANVTRAQRDAVLGFLLASKNSASEEISGIAASLYSSQEKQLCASVAKLSQLDQKTVLIRVKSGLSVAGKPMPGILCK